jgi:hypothetical protein
MPILLPPTRSQPKTEDADFSPLLSIIAALLALLLVFAEAQSMGIVDWPVCLSRLGVYVALPA